MNEQFLLGARNQAFTTEYVGGIETVKSLQMEPQLSARYSDYLAEYLRSGFSVRQIGNTYNTISNGLEQMMTLLILIIGAYTVMTNTDFTIGMLIAFQMYASKVSQPMQRVLLGLQPLTPEGGKNLFEATTAYLLRVQAGIQCFASIR